MTEQGLTPTSSFQDVKRITSIASLDEFYFYLSDCSPVTHVLDIKWNHKILYRAANLATPTSSTPTSEITDRDATVLPEPRQKVNQDVKNPSMTVPTSKGVQVTSVKPQTAKDSISSDSFTELDFDAEENTSFYTIGLKDLPTSSQFVVFHALVYDTIQAWTVDKSLQNHPFTIKWKKANFAGMDRYKNFQQVAKILTIHTLFEYMEFIAQCPEVKQTYEWKWNPEELRYWYADLPLNVDLNKV